MARVPLAGRPPFAIEDDDVIYSTPQPTRRIKPEQPKDDRPISTYNAYDNYFDDKMDPRANQSRHDSLAHGAIGGGLLNYRDSYASDTTDIPTTTNKSKNQALFEAAVSSKSNAGPPAYQPSASSLTISAEKRIMAVANPEQRGAPSNPQPQQQARMNPPQPQNRGPSPSPPAAPVNVHIRQQAAPQPQRPSPAFLPPGQNPTSSDPRGPPPLNTQNLQRPPATPYGMSMTPHAIPSPSTSTPIQPVFIKPAFIKFEENLNTRDKEGSLTSHESTMPIMRSDKEETLLARTNGTGVGPRLPRVGDKRDGDDFWRRFSMVAKTETAKAPNEKYSPWLASTLNNGASMSRWVWFIGLVLLLCIIGGSVTIWWFTRGSPDHQIPVSIGGGASQAMTYSATGAAAASETHTTKKIDRPLITGTATFGFATNKPAATTRTTARAATTAVVEDEVDPDIVDEEETVDEEIVDEEETVDEDVAIEKRQAMPDVAAIVKSLRRAPAPYVAVPDGGFRLHRRRLNRLH